MHDRDVRDTRDTVKQESDIINFRERAERGNSCQLATGPQEIADNIGEGRTEIIQNKISTSEIKLLNAENANRKRTRPNDDDGPLMPRKNNRSSSIHDDELPIPRLAAKHAELCFRPDDPPEISSLQNREEVSSKSIDERYPTDKPNQEVECETQISTRLEDPESQKLSEPGEVKEEEENLFLPVIQDPLQTGSAAKAEDEYPPKSPTLSNNRVYDLPSSHQTKTQKPNLNTSQDTKLPELTESNCEINAKGSAKTKILRPIRPPEYKRESIVAESSSSIKLLLETDTNQRNGHDGPRIARGDAPSSPNSGPVKPLPSPVLVAADARRPASAKSASGRARTLRTILKTEATSSVRPSRPKSRVLDGKSRPKAKVKMPSGEQKSKCPPMMKQQPGSPKGLPSSVKVDNKIVKPKDRPIDKSGAADDETPSTRVLKERVPESVKMAIKVVLHTEVSKSVPQKSIIKDVTTVVDNPGSAKLVGFEAKTSGPGDKQLRNNKKDTVQLKDLLVSKGIVSAASLIAHAESHATKNQFSENNISENAIVVGLQSIICQPESITTAGSDISQMTAAPPLTFVSSGSVSSNVVETSYYNSDVMHVEPLESNPRTVDNEGRRGRRRASDLRDNTKGGIIVLKTKEEVWSSPDSLLLSWKSCSRSLAAVSPWISVVSRKL